MYIVSSTYPTVTTRGPHKLSLYRALYTVTTAITTTATIFISISLRIRLRSCRFT